MAIGAVDSFEPFIVDARRAIEIGSLDYVTGIFWKRSRAKEPNEKADNESYYQQGKRIDRLVLRFRSGVGFDIISDAAEEYIEKQLGDDAVISNKANRDKNDGGDVVFHSLNNDFLRKIIQADLLIKEKDQNEEEGEDEIAHLKDAIIPLAL